MNKLITVTLLLVVGTLTAQDSNVFLNRDFWKSNTTVKDVQEKINEGNDPTALSSNGFDATTNAILASASDAIIKHLLSIEGNDINKITHDGRTYLFWASSKGNLPIVSYLLENGARIDIVDDKGSSVLLFAAGGGQTNPELYDLLIANGVSINETNPKGANVIHQLISKTKKLKDLDYFLNKGLDLNSMDKAGHNTVDYAARTGNKEIIEQLIKKGVSYKDTNTDGSNAILVASKGSRGGGNSTEFFKYLEGLGVQPNVTDNDGVNPIHNLSYSTKDKGLFNYFITKGVSATTADNQGNTPLMNAASRNDLAIVEFFAANNSVNAKNKEGKTALMNAVHSNGKDVVQFLINNGADTNIIDEDGNNLAYYLIDSYSKRNEKSFNEKWELLTKKGLDITHLQKDGNNLLHLAVLKNDRELLDKIANYKVDINAKNANGLTPLHIAAMTTNTVDSIKHLLGLGAKVTVLSDFDESAYDLALENELLDKSKIEFLKQ